MSVTIEHAADYEGDPDTLPPPEAMVTWDRDDFATAFMDQQEAFWHGYRCGEVMPRPRRP